MSRVFDSTCVGNVVKIDGKTITPATVISEGVKSSTGVALMQGDKVHYLTSNATDIKDLITNIGSLIDKIVTALSGLDAGAPVPGTQAANIALITVFKTTMLAQKENLK